MKNDDYWLNHWIQEINSYTKGGELLELGCGEGRDSIILGSLGIKVLATDISDIALHQCRKNAPHISHELLDLSKPFPYRNERFKVIIASLCLHYFEWDITLDICNEINRCLAINGLLIVRVNSTNDVNHGASGHNELEPGLFNVKGHKKRFFNKKNLSALFASAWLIKSIGEKSIDRYQKPKSVWEIILEKVD